MCRPGQVTHILYLWIFPALFAAGGKHIILPLLLIEVLVVVGSDRSLVLDQSIASAQLGYLCTERCVPGCTYYGRGNLPRCN